MARSNVRLNRAPLFYLIPERLQASIEYGPSLVIWRSTTATPISREAVSPTGANDVGGDRIPAITGSAPFSFARRRMSSESRRDRVNDESDCDAVSKSDDALIRPDIVAQMAPFAGDTQPLNMRFLTLDM